ncbi:MAG: hypothetical protein LQ350_006524 [Teloschistes chrysophthalmus]|nr:MAG: hypothetical protein LQ350_006524 [Niorma chrysophthalma]
MPQKAHVEVLVSTLMAHIEPSKSNKQPRESKIRKDRILQHLTNAKPTTTNQFEIAARFEGLEERFRISNNYELADALRIRLDELYGESNRWTPEVLSFLLSLSDRPFEETKFEDLEIFRSPLKKPTLTWSEIIRDDPLNNDDGLWDNVDFARDGSDEDTDSLIPALSPSDAPSEASSDVEDISKIIQKLAVPPDNDALQNMRRAQYWTQAVNGAITNTTDDTVETEPHPGVITLAETQLIREIGSMLLGLPSSVYEEQVDGSSKVVSKYGLKHLSPTTVSQLLDNFARTRDEMARIRMWKHRDEKLPLAQTFQACILQRLAATENALAQIQTRLLTPNGGTSSLLSYYEEVQSSTHQLRQLLPVMCGSDHADKAQSSFRVLELLFKRVCMSQNIGDAVSFGFVLDIFLTCLQTYLKPLKHWMEQGELSPYDQSIFIREGKINVPLDSVWADRYILSFDEADQLHAPKFFHLAAKKILNAGKSVHFLKLLGWLNEVDQDHGQASASVTLESLCQSDSDISLDSFPERFDKALDEWIASSYHSSSALLRHCLETQYGLYQALDALEYVYLSRDGHLTDIIADAIFARIDRGRGDWNDAFVLTDLFRDNFISKRCIIFRNLNVRTKPDVSQALGKSRSVNILQSLRVTYTLPWPIANIVSKDTLSVFQDIFTLLLQVKRAKQMLERRFSRRLVSVLVKDKKGSRSILLRLRMLHCVNAILGYLTGIVLSPATADMRQRMAKADDLDGMILVHQAYAARLCEQFLLSKGHRSTLKAIRSLLDVIVLFTDTCVAYVGDSAPTNPPEIQSSRGLKRRDSRRKSLGAESDSDGEASDAEKEFDIPHAAVGSDSSVTKLEQMHDTFNQLHNFILVRLQDVSKGEEDVGAEMLANMFAIP